jgi:integrase
MIRTRSTKLGARFTIGAAGLIATILRQRASIARADRLAGHRFSDVADTLVRPLLGALRRQVHLSAKKPALDVTTLRRMRRATPPRTAAGARDRLMLVLGFAGGLRARELVASDVSDIHVTDQQLRLLPDARTGSWYVAREVTIPRAFCRRYTRPTSHRGTAGLRG